MIRRPAHARSRLGVEWLDARILFSGDVRVAVSDGDLVIKGKGGHCVEVSQFEDEITVATCGDDSINGGDEDFVTTKLRDDVRIKFRGGDNEVQISELLVPGRLSVRLLGPDNIVGLEASQVGGSLKLIADGGENTFDLAEVLVGRNLALRAGGDTAATFTGVQVGGNWKMRLGAGVDEVLADGMDVRGETVLKTGDGDDDVAIVDSVLAGGARIKTGAGDDAIEVSGSEGRRLRINGGSGENAMTVDPADNDFGKLVLKGFNEESLADV